MDATGMSSTLGRLVIAAMLATTLVVLIIRFRRRD
jgi:hypothetical protein